MQPIEIKKGVYWVGVIDWNIRDFHGYQTERGTTYNSYLVPGDKTVLFDTVKADFTGQFLSNLARVTDPAAIDYIIVNHVEMDHTGALPEVVKAVRPEKIFVSRSGAEALKAHHHFEDWPLEVVGEKDTIDAGGRTISFIGSAMIHWPDSMVSYIKEDRLLITNDIFGQHYATSERFDDEVERGELFHQSAKYYANIFYPMSPAVRKFLAKMDKLDLEYDMIAPDHGLIWRKNIDEIKSRYGSWSAAENRPAAVVVYDTMWESTAAMARAIARGLAGDGVSVRLFDLRKSHRSDVITEMLEARAVIVGSSLLNGGILPKMADMLTYMKGLRPGGKIGTVFGSYGWSDVVLKLLGGELEAMKIDLVDPGISVKYVPDEQALNDCMELGKRMRGYILDK